ncbi:hypothetical protein HDV00_000038 [Rhizophlyctis rosea]|nr:hypothetical protein HDV00_000038 [Rhizophlyctis rosea]
MDVVRRLGSRSGPIGFVIALIIGSEKGYVDILSMALEDRASSLNDGGCSFGHTRVNRQMWYGAAYDDKWDCIHLGLDMAAASGHLDVVHTLLNFGADVTIGGGNSIYWASVRGRADIVQVLLQAGDARRNRDLWGMQKGLIKAVELGHHQILRVYFSLGGRLPIETYHDIIKVATEKVHVGVIEVLIAIGIKDEDKAWALRMASAKGRAEVVKVLVAGGAQGIKRACWKASVNGHHNVTKTLRDIGACPAWYRNLCFCVCLLRGGKMNRFK